MTSNIKTDDRTEKEYEIMSFFAAAKTGNLDILQSLKVPVDTTDEFGNFF